MQGKKLTKLESLQRTAVKGLAEWVLNDKEYIDYVEYCDENSLQPENITAKKQFSHVYAKALVVMGYRFSVNIDLDLT